MKSQKTAQQESENKEISIADKIKRLRQSGDDGEPSPLSSGWLLLLMSVVILVLAIFYLFYAVEVMMRINSYVESLGLAAESADNIIAYTYFVYGLNSIVPGIAAAYGFYTFFGKGRIVTCQIIGICMLASSLLSVMLDFFVVDELIVTLTASPLLNHIVAVVIPLLFIYGAQKAKKSTFWFGIKNPYEEDYALLTDMPLIPLTTGLPHTYVIDGNLIALENLFPFEGDSSKTNVSEKPQVRIVTFAEMVGDGSTVGKLLPRSGKEIRYCRANILSDMVIGSMCIPQCIVPGFTYGDNCAPLPFSFVLSKNELLFASDDERFASIFSYYANNQITRKRDAASVLLEFMGFILHNNELILDEYDSRLDILQDNMSENLADIPQDFDDFTLNLSQVLADLVKFYSQFHAAASNISTSKISYLSDSSLSLFAILAQTAEYLSDDAVSLREQIKTIRSSYKTKIELHQNKVMKLMTVVTTVITPITLITGWYGMNFDLMPELHFGGAYYVCAFITVLLVAFELILFKKYRWF